jgi:hypothetical protein
MMMMMIIMMLPGTERVSSCYWRPFVMDAQHIRMCAYEIQFKGSCTLASSSYHPYHPFKP